MTTKTPRATRPLLFALTALFAGACGDRPPPASIAPAPPPGLAAVMEAESRRMLAVGKLPEADFVAVDAERRYRLLRGPRHPDAGRIAELVASIKLRRWDYEGAEQALLRALVVREAEAGPSTLRVAELLDLLDEATAPLAPERAAPFLQRALAIRRASLGPEHDEVTRTLTSLGSTFLRACRAVDAEAVLREALVIRERTPGANAMVAESLEKLADARWQVSDDPGAEQLLARAVAALVPVEATETARLARLLGQLAAKERDRKNFAAAAAYDERALAAAERHLAPASPVLVEVAARLAGTYRAQGNEAGARALFVRLHLVERVVPPGAPEPTSPPETATKPPARPRCEPPGSQKSSVRNASSVIAALAPDFRACYNHVLRRDPDMAGTVRLTANIGAGGAVLRVHSLAPASYHALMVECPMDRLLAAHFSPPEGGGATIVVPLTFASQ
jgi:hypothetical protein